MSASISPFASLRHRNFRLFFAGQTTSLIGTWMQSIAQGWLVLQLTNSAFAVGLVAAAGALPVLLFSLPAGVIVDRANKHRIIVVCQSLMLVDALVLTILVATHRVLPWHVGVLAAIVGCLSAKERVALDSIMAKLAREAEICYATVAMITDYDCWHPDHASVTLEEIVSNLNKNAENAQAVVRNAVRSMPAARGCKCGSALAHAILTDSAAIPASARKRLATIAGKYLSPGSR